MKTCKKFFNPTYLPLLFILLAFNCKDDYINPGFKSIEIVENGCGDTHFEKFNYHENVKGIITHTGSVINQFDIVAMPNGEITFDPLKPCNLPSEVERDGLEIVFSGHFVNLPHCVADFPFELTALKIKSDTEQY